MNAALKLRTTDTQKDLFFKNPKLLGLVRQIGLKFFEAFGVFAAKVSALFWHCQSLVHGKMYLGLFPKETLVFRSKTYNTQITPKYDIGRKEFGKEPSLSVFSA